VKKNIDFGELGSSGFNLSGNAPAPDDMEALLSGSAGLEGGAGMLLAATGSDGAPSGGGMQASATRGSAAAAAIEDDEDDVEDEAIEAEE
jgi:hypothetical protein